MNEKHRKPFLTFIIPKADIIMKGVLSPRKQAILPFIKGEAMHLEHKPFPPSLKLRGSGLSSYFSMEDWQCYRQLFLAQPYHIYRPQEEVQITREVLDPYKQYDFYRCTNYNDADHLFSPFKCYINAMQEGMHSSECHVCSTVAQICQHAPHNETCDKWSTASCPRDSPVTWTKHSLGRRGMSARAASADFLQHEHEGSERPFFSRMFLPSWIEDEGLSSLPDSPAPCNSPYSEESLSPVNSKMHQPSAPYGYSKPPVPPPATELKTRNLSSKPRPPQKSNNWKMPVARKPRLGRSGKIVISKSFPKKSSIAGNTEVVDLNKCRESISKPVTKKTPVTGHTETVDLNKWKDRKKTGVRPKKKSRRAEHTYTVDINNDQDQENAGDQDTSPQPDGTENVNVNTCAAKEMHKTSSCNFSKTVIVPGMEEEDVVNDGEDQGTSKTDTKEKKSKPSGQSDQKKNKKSKTQQNSKCIQDSKINQFRWASTPSAAGNKRKTVNGKDSNNQGLYWQFEPIKRALPANEQTKYGSTNVMCNNVSSHPTKKGNETKPKPKSKLVCLSYPQTCDRIKARLEEHSVQEVIAGLGLRGWNNMK